MQQFIYAWHCTGDASSSDCEVTSMATVTPATTTASTSVPYGDWLFVNAIIVGCLFFVTAGSFFSLLRRR